MDIHVITLIVNRIDIIHTTVSFNKYNHNTSSNTYKKSKNSQHMSTKILHTYEVVKQKFM